MPWMPAPNPAKAPAPAPAIAGGLVTAAKTLGANVRNDLNGWHGAPMPQPPPAPSAAPASAPPAAAPPSPTGPTGPLSGPGTGETWDNSHLSQYDKPTDLETFANQQLNGNNPYYQRMQQQGDDAINQQMAARGHYNSGGALDRLGNYNGALGAAQFKDMGDLLGAAGGMGLNRLNSGANVAGASQGMERDRYKDQWGNLSDLAHLGAGTTGGFYGQGGQQSGDAAMAGINAGANAGQLKGQGQNAQGSLIWGGINGLLARK
jgi:hypothetical protein